ncbi:MAG: response regulator [Candidatus Omnitrophica bacterium]|nr:response regulator [Candidatus Omnitrophota bacterium]
MPKVLVVDDERSIRDVLRIFLEKKGFDVTCIDDGSKALSIIDSGEEYDIILLDNRMPGLKGFEVLEEMRKKQTDIPVILLTGSVGVNDDIPSTRAVLRKPIDLNTLIDTINDILNG